MIRHLYLPGFWGIFNSAISHSAEYRALASVVTTINLCDTLRFTSYTSRYVPVTHGKRVQVLWQTQRQKQLGTCTPSLSTVPVVQLVYWIDLADLLRTCISQVQTRHMLGWHCTLYSKFCHTEVKPEGLASVFVTTVQVLYSDYLSPMYSTAIVYSTTCPNV